MSTHDVLVTGTGTGVGKTVVTGGIAAALHRKGREPAVLKPVETGLTEGIPTDGRFLKHAAKRDEHLVEIVPEQYEEPLAPTVAARRSDRPVSLRRIERVLEEKREQNEYVLVEGAGGFRVPITPDREIADLAERWNMPVLIAARPSLGTLNHTVLTVEAIRNRGLRIAGIILSGYPENPDVAEETNPDELRRMTGIESIYTLPEVPDLDTERVPSASLLETLADVIHGNLDVTSLMSFSERKGNGT